MSNSDTPITCADIPVGKTVTVKVPASSAKFIVIVIFIT